MPMYERELGFNGRAGSALFHSPLLDKVYFHRGSSGQDLNGKQKAYSMG